MLRLFLLSWLSGVCLSVSAATLFDVNLWMRAIDQRSVSVQRHIQRADVEAAVADARELALMYQRLQDFFLAEPNAQDGARWSREGLTDAQQALSLLSEHKFDQATQSIRRITSGCHDCHDLYKPYR